MHTPNAREAFTSPFFWAFLLMCVLVGGVALGFMAMRREASSRTPHHLKPLAMLEAMVAISAGVLLWMGFWDFIDVYLVPRQWWAKLCMVVVGALGSILTRSLYDEQLIEVAGGEGGDDPPRSPRSASLGGHEAQSRGCGPAAGRERKLSSSSFGSGLPPVLGSPVLCCVESKARRTDQQSKHADWPRLSEAG